jgi:oxygen-independent coproporphyrinogen-3 oxidase
VPFCAHHCGYCDFAIAVDQDNLIDRYLDALAVELATLGTPQPVDTIFLGGGTPTHLDARQLERLLGMMRRWLPPKPGHEFTVEANPGTLDDEKVKVLAEHGVTRVSLGAQSFHRGTLAVLDRDHVPDDVPRAVECVRRHIGQLSLDLIFGAPGQTLSDWEDDLRRALALAADHVSTYGLTYEGNAAVETPARDEVRARTRTRNWPCTNAALTHWPPRFEHYEISISLVRVAAAGTTRFTGPTRRTSVSAWGQPATSAASAR